MGRPIVQTVMDPRIPTLVVLLVAACSTGGHDHRRHRARMELKVYTEALELYRLEHYVYPEAEQELFTHVPGEGDRLDLEARAFTSVAALHDRFGGAGSLEQFREELHEHRFDLAAGPR